MASLGGAMGHRFLRSIKRELGHNREHEILGGQRVRSYEVAAEIFRHLKADAQQARLLRRTEMSECVVTCP
jgi:hypothetical protein